MRGELVITRPEEIDKPDYRAIVYYNQPLYPIFFALDPQAREHLPQDIFPDVVVGEGGEGCTIDLNNFRPRSIADLFDDDITLRVADGAVVASTHIDGKFVQIFFRSDVKGYKADIQFPKGFDPQPVVDALNASMTEIYQRREG
jgi:hypothetical protein